MTEPGPRPPEHAQAEAPLPRHRLVAALFFFAARFLPVPFLDDVARAAVAGYVVRRAVEGHPDAPALADLAPLREPAGGCLGGCLGLALRVPLTLLLFPVRKALSLLLAVRGAARDVAEIVLLGRVVERALADGTLSGRRGPDLLRGEALALRVAFDRALGRTDLHVLEAALRLGLGPPRRLALAGLAALRAFLRGDGATPASPSPALEAGESALARVFASPEVRAVLEAFDARLAEARRDAANSASAPRKW